MATQPDGMDAGAEPPAIRRFRGEGWFNLWGVILLVILGCIGVCLYLLVSAGAGVIVTGRLFGSAAMLALLLGVCLLGRWSVPYLLTRSGSIDPRSASLMRSPRTAWYLWWRTRR
jgi:hypothetical protein